MKKLVASLAAAVAATVLAACGGGTEAASPEDAVAAAVAALQGTSGVHMELTTDKVPDGATGLIKASGDLSAAPGFKGSLQVNLAIGSGDIQIISIDGKFYAQLPFASGFQEIDPVALGFPDPGSFLAQDGALVSLLQGATNLASGDKAGAYTATIPVDSLRALQPAASGDFDTTFTVNDKGELTSAVITGRFYGDQYDANTYHLDLSDYGISPEIAAP